MNVELDNIEIKNIESIIATYLADNATIDDKTYIDKWLAENRENKLLFAQLADVWEVTGMNKNIESDTDEKFNQLKTKIKAQSKLSYFISPIFKYAAIFIIALTLGGLISYSLLPNNQNINKQMAENQIIVPKGSKTHMILPDGSEIWLNSGSKLTYNDGFTSGNNREVSLEGEGFFNVSKNKKKPFIVNANKMKIEVLGTSFNLKSYAEDDIVETTLIEGSVKLIRKSKGKDKVVYLEPNEKATYNPAKKKIKILKFTDEKIKQKEIRLIKKAEQIKPKTPEIIESIVSWKDQILVFNSDNLQDIEKKLERWYGYDIILKDSDMLKETYTGKFEHNETITMVLDVIKATSPIEYKINNNKITIQKKKND